MTDDLARQCAATVMDTFHLMMRTIGGEAKRHPQPEFSMQQFRTMMTIRHHDGGSLSVIAEHLGCTLSAASKIVDGLVDRGYVTRTAAESDRRKLILTLTEAGEQAVEAIRLGAISCLAQRLTSLTSNECAMLGLAMDLLRSSIVNPQAQQAKQQIDQQGG